MSSFRLDKYLADAGIGTRSEIKKYIRQGLVSVNAVKAEKPDTRINPDTDFVCYKNERVRPTTFEYYILNKPAGYVSATQDNTAPTVLSLIRSTRKDLFPVGRLDKDTEGLLLITNNGALSHYLLSPKHHVDKTYYAVIEGEVTANDVSAFENGLYIGDKDLQTALPAKLSIIEPYNMEKKHSYVEITIHEGKFHQIKRMFQALGKKVIYLKRLKMGPLTLPKDLAPGKSRPLTEDEYHLLEECFIGLKH